MFRIFSFLLLLFALQVQAQLPQTVLEKIEDSAFRDCVAREAESRGWNTAEEVVDLTCRSMGIKSAIGIEQFSNLGGLGLNYNNLENIDLSQNSAIAGLHLRENNITALDLSGNPDLVTLDASFNNLQTLDLSQNPTLHSLYLQGNELTAVDLSANPDLEVLVLTDNRLTSLDLSHNSLLRNAWIDNNRLVDIKFPDPNGLDRLSLNDNALTTIDLSSLLHLRRLPLANNNISDLDLKHNEVVLDVLDIRGNPLSARTVAYLNSIDDHTGSWHRNEDDYSEPYLHVQSERANHSENVFERSLANTQSGSSAEFYGGLLTIDNYAVGLEGPQEEPYQLVGIVEPEEREIGMVADYFLAAGVETENGTRRWFYRDVDGVWRPWSTRIADLAPTIEEGVLEARTEIDISTGTFLPGTYTVYLGYMLSETRELIYGVTPISFIIE